VIATAVCESGVQGVPPVPDGNLAPGQPMTAALAGPGSGDVVVTWDVSNCPGLSYHLYEGRSADLAGYQYSQAHCQLDPSGQDTVPITDPAPGEFTWWVIVGADGDIEGHHGFDSAGNIRPADGVGFCGVLRQVAGSCP